MGNGSTHTHILPHVPATVRGNKVLLYMTAHMVVGSG